MWLIALLLATNLTLAIHWRITKDDSPWSELVATAVGALLVIGFTWHERDTVLPALRAGHLRARDWLGCGLLFVAMGACVELWFFVAHHVFDFVDMLAPYREHDWPKWVAVLSIVVCPAIFEELAFRGFLMARLTSLIGPRDALLMQASLFAILHMSPLILPSHFVIGLGLGVMRQRTGSLIPGMLAHAAWNTYCLVGDGLLADW